MDQPYKKSFDGAPVVCETKHIPAGYVYEMHWHDYIEMEFILSGEAEHIYNSERARITAADAYIITPHDVHALHAVTELTLINVCFEESLLDTDVRDALTHSADHTWYGRLSEQALAWVQEHLARTMQQLHSAQPLSDTLVRLLMSELVIAVMRLSVTSAAAAPTLIGQAIAYVHAHFRQPLTVSELARCFAITPNYMGKLFLSHTGMSFNSYLGRLRCRYACNMLRYSTLQVRDVALEAGFSSVEYFFSSFKKQMGMTPNAYRHSCV